MAKKKQMTAMERLRELRKDREKAMEAILRKPANPVIKIKSTKKSKRFEDFLDSINPKVWLQLLDLTDDELLELMYYGEDLEDWWEEVEMNRAKDKRLKKEAKEREKLLDKELESIKPKAKNLKKINKLIRKYSDDTWKKKKYKKYGYDVIDGELVVNEKKLVQGIRKRSKEFSRGIDAFKLYLEKFMGEDNPVLDKVKAKKKQALKNYDKASYEFLESFEAVARESSFYKLK